jgi:LmbE family N-acetylglucosaminyl deacetylase
MLRWSAPRAAKPGKLRRAFKRRRKIWARCAKKNLRCAAEKIGVNNLYFLDYRDSGMLGTPENNHPHAFWQANLFEVAEKLVRIIRRHKPHVILTFDPNGGYGHPDHIKIHQASLIAYFVSGDPRIYPDQIAKEGLEPWTVSKLYWGAFPRSRFEKYAELAKQAGIDLGVPMQEFLKRAQPDEIITTRIDVSPYVDLKLSALYCHASQMNPNSIFSKIPIGDAARGDEGGNAGACRIARGGARRRNGFVHRNRINHLADCVVRNHAIRTTQPL